MTYFELTKIDRDLVLEFFLDVSRFEFALKAIGYDCGPDDNVKPDWDRFSIEFGPAFDRNMSEDLAVACDYYFAYPPQKQVRRNGQLEWAVALPTYASDLQNLLVLVRRVRNNLFHGGKYNSQRQDETDRNSKLLRTGLVILQQALKLAPKLKKAYDEAAI